MLEALPASSQGVCRSAEATGGRGGCFGVLFVFKKRGWKEEKAIYLCLLMGMDLLDVESLSDKLLPPVWDLLHSCTAYGLFGFFCIKLFTSTVHRIIDKKTKLMFHGKSAK